MTGTRLWCIIATLIGFGLNGPINFGDPSNIPNAYSARFVFPFVSARPVFYISIGFYMSDPASSS
jgi:hypothetical protein